MYVLHGICYSLSDLFSSVKQALGSSTSLELTQIRFFLWLSNIPLYAAAAAKSLQSCLTLYDPIDGSPPGSPSLRVSRQEHWSGLPFPSPMHASEK